MGGVIGQDQRGSATFAWFDFQRQVYAAERDGSKRFAINILQKRIDKCYERTGTFTHYLVLQNYLYFQNRVSNDKNGPLENVSQSQNMNLLKALVRLAAATAGCSFCQTGCS